MQSSVDALPYIDAQPSVEALAAAQALIQAQLAQEHPTELHPSIPTTREPKYSDLIEAEHARIAAGGEKAVGIDLSRYEALDAPEDNDPEAWRNALRQAYTSAEYLHGREMNLSLLEAYGKNAWLIGNSQLEDILKGLERDVEGAKLELEEVEQARRAVQGNAAGEMHGLEETWRQGVGRMIEAQAAGEGLRQEILQRKRMAAS